MALAGAHRDSRAATNLRQQRSTPAYSASCKANSAAEVGLYTTEFPYLNYITQAQSGAISNYNALQVTVNERVSHGLSFLAGYTWAHALDDGTIVYPS